MFEGVLSDDDTNDLDQFFDALSDVDEKSNGDSEASYEVSSPAGQKSLSSISTLTNSTKSDYTLGYKGKLSTKHTNSSRKRKLTREHWLDEFERQLNENSNAKEILRQYDDAMQGNRIEEADGIIISMINIFSLQERLIKSVFNVGTYRLKRLKKGQTFTVSNAVTDKELNVLQKFLEQLPCEEGYPCQHRRMKYYFNLDEEKPSISGWESLHKHKYIPFAEKESKDGKVMAYKTFHKYVRGVFPQFAFQRAQEDACNTCEKLKTALKDPKLPGSDKARIKARIKK